MNFRSILMKTLAVLVGLISFYIMSLDDFSTLYITLGTISLISAFVLYIFSSPKAYNASVSSIKQIANPHNKSVEDIYEAFKGKESILGTPWLGKVKFVTGNSVIFGPSSNGDFIHIHKMFNAFYLSLSEFSNLITAPVGDEWRLDVPGKEMNFFDNKHAICYSLRYQTMVDDLLPVITEFCENNKVLPLPNDKNLGKLYRFDENFKITGQKFTLIDFDTDIPIYEVEATFPLISFSMREIATQKEVFHIEKKIFNLLSTYEFSYMGENYGTFKEKIDIMHDVFEMQTQDGKLEMRSINDRFGTNYIVKINNKVIGSIAERFTLSLHNIVFDNFILHAREEKYTPLLGALTVMAARELARDTCASTRTRNDIDDGGADFSDSGD